MAALAPAFLIVKVKHHHHVRRLFASSTWFRSSDESTQVASPRFYASLRPTNLSRGTRLSYGFCAYDRNIPYERQMRRTPSELILGSCSCAKVIKTCQARRCRLSSLVPFPIAEASSNPVSSSQYYSLPVGVMMTGQELNPTSATNCAIQESEYNAVYT